MNGKMCFDFEIIECTCFKTLCCSYLESPIHEFQYRITSLLHNLDQLFTFMKRPSNHSLIAGRYAQLPTTFASYFDGLKDYRKEGTNRRGMKLRNALDSDLDECCPLSSYSDANLNEHLQHHLGYLKGIVMEMARKLLMNFQNIFCPKSSTTISDIPVCRLRYNSITFN